jgi:hypothetical protein
MTMKRLFGALADLILGHERIHNPETVDTRYIAMKVRAAEDSRFIATRR